MVIAFLYLKLVLFLIIDSLLLLCLLRLYDDYRYYHYRSKYFEKKYDMFISKLGK